MRATVKVESKHCAFISGYGTRDLLMELRPRAPLWSVRERAWVTTERTAMDLVALAERRGWDIWLTATPMSATPTSATRSNSDLVDHDDDLDPGRGLW